MGPGSAAHHAASAARCAASGARATFTEARAFPPGIAAGARYPEAQLAHMDSEKKRH
jgi:hypothetical protein